MDAIDLRILEILLGDGRVTMKELGQRVGLTSPATIERVKKLEDTDVIKGYKAIVNVKKTGLPIRAFILVKTNVDTCKKFLEFSDGHGSVLSCHRITGDADYLVEVVATGMDTLERLIDEFMQYGVTKTHVVLSSSMEQKSVALPG
ncbi:Lrp/AsnC family leucine-responsive transcriptional regulator [Anaerospora hongkongensis]|uniref:Lrp/AsnC family leucine-responsive transcriptional regulator n=1 Tax=Anaerospora hongkongensis TaxID=244830 RepID=A0A4R1PP01_9FIRM|nr:Lrp/AsnC family transcriptional regulator [Anaerospora hongkongensis]TCL32473.1 Lrp/AsnC family leucine-responsive transcriptional regulator [Anaerospora hongkongensis]